MFKKIQKKMKNQKKHIDSDYHIRYYFYKLDNEVELKYLCLYRIGKEFQFYFNDINLYIQIYKLATL